MKCRVTRCVGRGHFVGTFEAPFCSACFHKLTPHKMASVVSISTFSVLDPRSRTRAEAIITNCRKYLATKGEHETAASRYHRADRVA
jgi:hypothetical protein